MAQSTVTWLQVDVPPYYILEGALQGQGIVDQITAQLITRLPTYHHQTQLVSFQRALNLLSASEIFCHAAFFRTSEREHLAHFSTLASSLSPPIGVSIKRHKRTLFDESLPISLSLLLQQLSLRGGVVSGRSYGEQLDALLTQYKNAPHLFFRTTHTLYSGSFAMLMADRLDYLIGYPSEAMFAGHQLDFHDVITLPIQESQTYQPGYVACSRNAQSQQLLQSIDQILGDIRATPAYRSIFHRWLDDISRTGFDQAFDELVTPPVNSSHH